MSGKSQGFALRRTATDVTGIPVYIDFVTFYDLIQKYCQRLFPCEGLHGSSDAPRSPFFVFSLIEELVRLGAVTLYFPDGDRPYAKLKNARGSNASSKVNRWWDLVLQRLMRDLGAPGSMFYMGGQPFEADAAVGRFTDNVHSLKQVTTILTPDFDQCANVFGCMSNNAILWKGDRRGGSYYQNANPELNYSLRAAAETMLTFMVHNSTSKQAHDFLALSIAKGHDKTAATFITTLKAIAHTAEATSALWQLILMLAGCDPVKSCGHGVRSIAAMMYDGKTAEDIVGEAEFAQRRRLCLSHWRYSPVLAWSIKLSADFPHGVIMQIEFPEATEEKSSDNETSYPLRPFTPGAGLRAYEEAVAADPELRAVVLGEFGIDNAGARYMELRKQVVAPQQVLIRPQVPAAPKLRDPVTVHGKRGWQVLLAHYTAALQQFVDQPAALCAEFHTIRDQLIGQQVAYHAVTEVFAAFYIQATTPRPAQQAPQKRPKLTQ